MCTIGTPAKNDILVRSLFRRGAKEISNRKTAITVSIGLQN
jgi:hypothetical protein